MKVSFVVRNRYGKEKIETLAILQNAFETNAEWRSRCTGQTLALDLLDRENKLNVLLWNV